MIQMNNVAIGYNGVAIREGLCYNFEENKIYGILGESGIGKTTFMKTIAKLIPAVDGDIVYGLNPKDIFMMHQHYTCFNWLNCLDNILICDKVKHQKITEARRTEAFCMLKAVGLEQYSSQMSDTYPTQLSGGQRQRLALARILYAKPKVILMDEPMSALDDNTRTAMQLLVKGHQKITGCTIIMVTHSPAEAKLLCDEIINF